MEELPQVSPAVPGNGCVAYLCALIWRVTELRPTARRVRPSLATPQELLDQAPLARAPRFNKRRSLSFTPRTAVFEKSRCPTWRASPARIGDL
jgi:hypothetical protein